MRRRRLSRFDQLLWTPLVCTGLPAALLLATRQFRSFITTLSPPRMATNTKYEAPSTLQPWRCREVLSHAVRHPFASLWWLPLPHPPLIPCQMHALLGWGAPTWPPARPNAPGLSDPPRKVCRVELCRAACPGVFGPTNFNLPVNSTRPERIIPTSTTSPTCIGWRISVEGGKTVHAFRWGVRQIAKPPTSQLTRHSKNALGTKIWG